MLADARIKTFLQGVTDRARVTAQSYEWATGSLDLLPDLLPTISVEERDALKRLAKQAQSYGPHALSVLKNGTIGSINWGKGNDDATRELRLSQLANRFHLQGRVTGMMAGHVYVPEGTAKARIQRLGGYLEPLRDPDDVDYEWGIYQALATHLGTDGNERWRVRIYDLEREEVYEWENLRQPYEIGRIPDPVKAKMPRYAILNEDVDGLPFGEFMAALPLLKAEWAAQIRSDRAADTTATPQMTISGEATGYEERGPTRVILLNADGKAQYLLPGDLSKLHEHHDRKLERLRQVLNLPGVTAGAQRPSGEALREMNLKFTSSCQSMAEALSDLLSDLTADYAKATGAEMPERVSVNINRSYIQEQMTEQVVLLVGKGLMDKPSAVRILSQFFQEWDDSSVEAFIATLTGEPPPESGTSDAPPPNGTPPIPQPGQPVVPEGVANVRVVRETRA